MTDDRATAVKQWQRDVDEMFARMQTEEFIIAVRKMLDGPLRVPVPTRGKVTMTSTDDEPD